MPDVKNQSSQVKEDAAKKDLINPYVLKNHFFNYRRILGWPHGKDARGNDKSDRSFYVNLFEYIITLSFIDTLLSPIRLVGAAIEYYSLLPSTQKGMPGETQKNLFWLFIPGIFSPLTAMAQLWSYNPGAYSKQSDKEEDEEFVKKIFMTFLQLLLLFAVGAAIGALLAYTWPIAIPFILGGLIHTLVATTVGQAMATGFALIFTVLARGMWNGLCSFVVQGITGNMSERSVSQVQEPESSTTHTFEATSQLINANKGVINTDEQTVKINKALKITKAPKSSDPVKTVNDKITSKTLPTENSIPTRVKEDYLKAENAINNCNIVKENNPNYS